jgi:hypothetical protein
MIRFRFLAAVFLTSLPAPAAAQYCPWAYNIKTLQLQQNALLSQASAAQLNQLQLQLKQQAQWSQVMPKNTWGSSFQTTQLGQLNFNGATSKSALPNVNIYLPSSFAVFGPGYRPFNISMVTRPVTQVTWKPQHQQFQAGNQVGARQQTQVTSQYQTMPQVAMIAKQQQQATAQQQIVSQQKCTTMTQTRTIAQISLNASCNRCHHAQQPAPNPMALQRSGPLPDPLQLPGPLPFLLESQPLSPFVGRLGEVPWQQMLPRSGQSALPQLLVRSGPLTLPQRFAQPQPLPELVVEALLPKPWLPAIALPTPAVVPHMIEEPKIQGLDVLARQPAVQAELMKGKVEGGTQAKDLIALPDLTAEPALLMALPATVLQVPVAWPAKPNLDGRAAVDDAANEAQTATSLRLPRPELQMPTLALPDTVLQLPEPAAFNLAGKASEPEGVPSVLGPLPALVVQPPRLPAVPETVLQPPAPRPTSRHF